MASTETVQFARAMMKIQDRYNNQEISRTNGVYKYVRKDWTPAQKRSMRRSYRRLLKKFGRVNLSYPSYML